MRIDSISEQMRIAKSAHKEIVPPAHVQLSDRDMVFFNNIISEFAKAEWTEHSLEIAAMLARVMSDLEEQQGILRAEGYIATRENGTTVENPRARVTKSLTGDILSLRRSLALHAHARGDSDKLGKRKEIAKAIENSVMDSGDDSLIPRMQ